MNEIGRVCTRCEIWKPFEEMCKHLYRKDGMGSWCLECNRKFRKVKSDENKSKGRCRKCGSVEVDIDKTYCNICLTDMRNARKSRKSKGICVSCLAESLRGSFYCKACLNRKKEDRDRKKIQGECADCPSDALVDSIYCRACLGIHNLKSTECRARKISRGICVHCGAQAIPGKAYCARCKIYYNVSNAIRETMQGRGFSKEGKRWESFVDYPFKDLYLHLLIWKEIQELSEKDSIEIHHINPRSESRWEIPGDEEWRRLWALENLIPLTRKAHDEVHAEKYKNIHPLVRDYLLGHRKRRYIDNHLRSEYCRASNY